MPNPFELRFRADCDHCGDRMAAGDECFFVDGDKWCEECAGSAGYRCECGAFKRPDFDECYECSQA